MSEWEGYVLEDFDFGFEPGSQVLDVGCGEGSQIAELESRNVAACGVDVYMPALIRCRQRGLRTIQSRSEKLPFVSESFDGVICKVVIPLADERQTLMEISRVLRPGGILYLVSHGAGYYLRYLLQPPRAIYRVYAARTLVNTWLWVSTGFQLPGFMGDTRFQSRRRLLKIYKAVGLELEQEFPSKKYLGYPVFLYDRVRKLRT